MLDEPGFLCAAVLLVCVLSTARGALATLTAVPLAGQALQLLGLAFLAQLAWRRWGSGDSWARARDWAPRVSWPAVSASASPRPE